MRLHLQLLLTAVGTVALTVTHPKNSKIENLVKQNKLPDHQLVVNLEEAITTLARQSLLEPEDFIFDFNHLAKDPTHKNAAIPNPRTGSAMGLQGHIATANTASFPALIGEDVSMAIGTIGPCGMNTPHTHPRATEFNYVIQGNFLTGMLQENNARFVMSNVSTGQASLFPRGSIHFEANLDCTPSVFVAAFSNPEGGVLQVAQGFFGLPPAILDPTLGHLLTPDEESRLHSMIPANVARGLQECLSRCPIPVLSAPVVQRLLERTHITGYAYGIFVVALLVLFGAIHLGHRLGLGKNWQSGRRLQKYLMYAPNLFGPPPKDSKKGRRQAAELEKQVDEHPEKEKALRDKYANRWPGIPLPSRGDILLISVFWLANIVLTVWDLDEEQPAREAFHRVGWLATWNSVAVVILSLKASPLPWLVGKSHDGLVFYHKWIALTAFIQVWIHSIWGMFVVKYFNTDNVFRWKLPQTGAWISTVAFTVVILVAWLPWIAISHFEMFLVLHVMGYIILLVGLWIHNSLLKWYVVVLIALWVLDRMTRLLFLFYLRGFHKQYATLLISNQSTKVIIERKQRWSAGSHIYVNFPDCKPMQSHPYTIASIANRDKAEQEIILRIQRSSPSSTGFSNALYDIVCQKGQICDLPINYHGPYGAPPKIDHYDRILCIGGGSGITMPIALLQSFCANPTRNPRAATLVWCTRDVSDFLAFDLEKIENLGVHVYLYETKVQHKTNLLTTLLRKLDDVKQEMMPTSAARGQVTELEYQDESQSVNRSYGPAAKQGHVTREKIRAVAPRSHENLNEMEKVLQRTPNPTKSSHSAGISDMERVIGSADASPRSINHVPETTNSLDTAQNAFISHAEEEIDSFSTSSIDEKNIDYHVQSTNIRDDSNYLKRIPVDEYFGHKSTARAQDTATRIAAVRARPSFLSDTRMTVGGRPIRADSGLTGDVASITAAGPTDAEDEEFSPASASLDRLRQVFKNIGYGERPLWEEQVLPRFLQEANENDRLCVVVCGGKKMCREVRNAVALSSATQQIDLHVEQFG